MQATFTGSIYSGYDLTGEFGDTDADLVGSGVSWTVTYDTSAGGKYESEEFSQLYGGTGYLVPSPIISSVITVNGQSQTLSTGHYDYIDVYDRDEDVNNPTYDQYSIQSSVYDSSCDGDVCTYTNDYAFAYTYGYFEYLLASGLDDPFTVDLTGLDAVNFGGFVLGGYTYDSSTGEYVYSEYAYGNYTFDSLVVTQVSAVPLPASFGLILAALGGIGGLRVLRRRTGRAV